ncbi:two-component response regulator receiver, CheY-like protein [Sulfurimonas gotlandica GD1]|uniref:Two-component response regulator receiver, CheY-like protein n=2 Tax=Sulfurimonas TaxID=202746 RepID=H1FS02_SULGG|nr:two-component response regulator receiver, CheY-like protein [Sulfurimonas gotlandica GD1]
MIVKIIKKALLTNTIDGYLFDEHNIYTASDGMEAFGVMGEGHNIKLIVSDINMPYLNGDEFIEILQDTGKLEELEVVFVTASSTKLTLSRSIKENTLGVIYKPFRFDGFIEKLKHLQANQSIKDREIERIKERQIEKKKFIEKICLIYLDDLDLEWITDTLDSLINETFSNAEISEDDYPEMIYSIISTYLFEEEITHKTDAKKISCIIKNNGKQVELSENRFALIDDFKSQIKMINSKELEPKAILEAIMTPSLDKISMATSQVRKFHKIKTKLYAPHFKYIIEELTKLDCDFPDIQLRKLVLEQKEIADFSQFIYDFLDKNEISKSIKAVSSSEALGIELARRLNKMLKLISALSRHYCGNIEFYIWKRARESSEIYEYLKRNMPKSMPSSSRFLLHKNKITSKELQFYLPYEKQKVLVLSNSLQTLGVFKGEVNESLDKWNFFCFTKISLLDAWVHSNIPDKIIIDYKFRSSVFDDGIEFLKLALKQYPIMKDAVTMDQLYFIANKNDYEKLRKYKSTHNFSIIEEPLTLNGIYETLVYD